MRRDKKYHSQTYSPCSENLPNTSLPHTRVIKREKCQEAGNTLHSGIKKYQESRYIYYVIQPALWKKCRYL